MTEHLLILSKANSQEEAEKIAQALVQEYLAACVTIISGAQSVYRWKGQMERAEEWTLLIKTTALAAETTICRLVELHSAELPEAIILPIRGGHVPYLQWIDSQVEGDWADID